MSKTSQLFILILLISISKASSIKFNQTVKLNMPKEKDPVSAGPKIEECESPRCELCHPYGEVCIKCIK